MFPTLLASFWSDLSVFHEKMRITKKSKKYFFFEKKMYFFFFLNFLFFDIFSHFSGGKKKTKFFVFFSYKKNLRNVFELKFWHEKLISFNENFFGAFNRLLLRLKIFFTFLRFMSMFWTSLKKKNWKFEKNFQKSSIFEISFVGLRPKFRPIGRKFRQKYSFAQNSYQKNFE